VEFGPHQDTQPDNTGFGRMLQMLSTPETVRFNNRDTVRNTDLALKEGTARSMTVLLNGYRARTEIERLRERFQDPIPYDAYRQGTNSNSLTRRIIAAGGGDVGTVLGYNPRLGMIPSGAPFPVPGGVQSILEKLFAPQ
jgi:hypothetical protein